MAAVVGVAGLVCLFKYDLYWGLSGLLSTMVLVPAFAYFAAKIWPSTPMGRRIIGMPTEEEANSAKLAEQKERDRWTSLIGREGVALTALRPVGVLELDGVRYDALSETMYVPAGSRVKVTHADGSQIKVRQIS